jgi:MFS family permease
VLVLSAAGLAFYPIATAFVPSAEWLIPAAVVWGAFISGIDIAFFEVLLRTCPADRRSVFIGANAAAANLAIFIGPLAGTMLIGVIDVRLVLALSGILSLIGAALFGLLAVGRARGSIAVRA